METMRAPSVRIRFAETAMSGEENPQPITIEEYKEECAELSEKLTLNLLTYKLNEEINTLLMYLGEGHKLQLAVLPFSDMGMAMEERALREGDFLRFLIVNEHGKTIYGFSAKPSYISRILPTEIQDGASIVIPANMNREQLERYIRDKVPEALENLRDVLL